jgi:hypothetical protein
VVVTDKLASYVPAIKRVLTNTEHRRHKRLTTELRIRIGRSASASGRCSGSNHPSRRSDSWRPSARCATTSVHVGTVFQLSATARSCASDSSNGARSPVWRQQLGPQPERSASGRPPARQAAVPGRLPLINLSMPIGLPSSPIGQPLSCGQWPATAGSMPRPSTLYSALREIRGRGFGKGGPPT